MAVTSDPSDTTLPTEERKESEWEWQMEDMAEAEDWTWAVRDECRSRSRFRSRAVAMVDAITSCCCSSCSSGEWLRLWLLWPWCRRELALA